MVWKLHKNYNWEELERDFHFIKELKNTPQNLEYHGEGDVATHTKMVLDQLLNLEEFKKLDQQKQEILKAAALLHDIEKRSTTKIGDRGKLQSKNHAKKGAKTVYKMLYQEIDTPFYIRKEISNLVKYHGLPLWFLDKKNPQKVIVKLSLEVNIELLSILSKADILGRVADDKEDLLERVELFTEYAKEERCFKSGRKFSTEGGKFNYLTKDDAYIDYTPFETGQNFKITLISGLPGAGKDHYIKNSLKGLKVISLDQIRREFKISPTDKKGNGKVIQEAKKRAKEYLKDRVNFVWNGTNITKDLRAQLIELFANYGAKIEIIYIETSYKKLLDQNKDRDYVVPEKVIEKLINKLDIPEKSEAHFVKYIINE